MARTYTVILRKEPEGSYTVIVPALPGCLTYGNTVEEALENAREVVPLFLDALADLGKPIPPDEPQVSLNMTEMEQALVCRVTVGEEVAVA